MQEIVRRGPTGARTFERLSRALVLKAKRMASASRFSKGNMLLSGLDASDLALLQPSLSPISLPLRHEMEKPQKQIADVYFMEKGIASVVAMFPYGAAVEVGLIGCEGMSGTAIVLGNDRSPHSTYIQVTGEGKRIAVDDLRAAMKKSESLRSRLLKYVQAFSVQTAHTAVANAKATLPQRLARRILMSHDRVSGDRLELTHEFLSLMLAVRRAGVTEAVHALVSQKLITASRGEITVANRKGLEKVAGNFYGAPEAEYRRLMN